jgi:hypothetical protein
MDIVLRVGNIEIVFTGRIRVEDGFFQNMLLVKVEENTSPTTSKNLPLVQSHTLTLISWDTSADLVRLFGCSWKSFGERTFLTTNLDIS